MSKDRNKSKEKKSHNKSTQRKSKHFSSSVMNKEHQKIISSSKIKMKFKSRRRSCQER